MIKGLVWAPKGYVADGAYSGTVFVFFVWDRGFLWRVLLQLDVFGFDVYVGFLHFGELSGPVTLERSLFSGMSSCKVGFVTLTEV